MHPAFECGFQENNYEGVHSLNLRCTSVFQWESVKCVSYIQSKARLAMNLRVSNYGCTVQYIFSMHVLA
jgi:hypothetical protein